MSNDLMMRMKDQVLIVLADYTSCKRDEIDQRLDLNLESKTTLVSHDIASRVMANYRILAKVDKSLPYIKEAQIEIATLIAENAKLKHDPWAACRDEGIRIRVAYAISRIIEAKAGKRHKFSVWSGIVYGARKVLPKRKAEDHHRGTRILVAAPSAKKAVELINEVLGCNENLSSFRDHWTGGGTLGVKVATKVGIWAGVKDEQFAHDENDWALIWEPK